MKPRYSGFEGSRVNPSQQEIQQMAQSGRRAIFGGNGQFMAFSSRPGATISPNDSIARIGTDDHNTAWNNFFHPKTSDFSTQPIIKPIAAGGFRPPNATDTTTAENNEDWANPTNPAIPDPIAASVANNTAWMGRNGVTVPPPPVPIDPVADASQTGWVNTSAAQASQIGLRYQTPQPTRVTGPDTSDLAGYG